MQEVTISNSSPIIHLAKIEQLDLLRDFFGELLIPEAVYEECMTQGQGAFRGCPNQAGVHRLLVEAGEKSG